VEDGYKNANYGISAGARFNVTGSHSIIAEYDQLFNKQENEEYNSKPQLALGWEIGTHARISDFFRKLQGYSGTV
jgi:hypothetical protein